MHGRSAWLSRFLLLALALSFGYADESPYTVKEKETLFSIAKRNRIPVDILCMANGIQDPSRIKAGSILKIPRSHTVGRGDTLFSIARQNGASLESILAFNGISDAGKIKAGDRIYFPPPADPAAAAAAMTAAAEKTLPAAAPEKKPDATALEPAKSAPSVPQQGAVGDPERRVVSWPHPGKREALRGKVTGLTFYGKQGDDVFSVTQGEVSWVGPYWHLGKVIIVRTEDGDLFLYAGNESLLVNKGDIVSPGMAIARLGVNPVEGVAKLFFSIRTASGRFVEPERISKG